MKTLLFIAIGGGAGAVSRYLVSLWINHLTQDGVRFPFATISVNLLGSFLIGVLFVLIAEKASLGNQWQSVLIVGFLGAFTTFSTFSLEVVTYLEKGLMINAILYLVSSVLLCSLAAWAGIALARSF